MDGDGGRIWMGMVVGGGLPPLLCFDGRRIRRGHDCPLHFFWQWQKHEGGITALFLLFWAMAGPEGGMTAPSIFVFGNGRSMRGHDCPSLSFG